MICFKTNTPFTFAWMVGLNQSNVLLQVYEFTYFISEKLQELGMNNHNYPKIIANIQLYPVCIVVSGVLTIVLESEHTTVNQLLNTHVGFLLDKKGRVAQ